MRVYGHVALFVPTALVQQVMQYPPSICLSIRLFPFSLGNRLTFDLELLLMSWS